MRTFRQHLALAFGAFLLAAGATLAATPAQAAPSPAPPNRTMQGDRNAAPGTVAEPVQPAGWSARINRIDGYASCRNFEFCAWEHVNAGQPGLAMTGNVACNDYYVWIAHTEHPWFENKASSFFNNTTVTVALVDRTTWGAWYDLLRIPPGNYGNLIHGPNGLADKADGIRVVC